MIDLMSFMEAMGTSQIAPVAAFFIGLMTSLSPCPMATNLTAIAYVSKNLQGGKHTALVGAVYTLGRAFAYTLLASLIVYFGLNVQQISFFLQTYGEKLLGPLMLLIGLVFLGLLNLPLPELGSQELKASLGKKGYLGAFLLGFIFALTFCPFSAVLFFGMLLPVALSARDGIVLPLIFGIATGLPVIIFSVLLAKGAERAASAMNKAEQAEKLVRKLAGAVFLIAGAYYLLTRWG